MGSARVQDGEDEHDDQQRVHVQRKGVPVHPAHQAHDRCGEHRDLRGNRDASELQLLCSDCFLGWSRPKSPFFNQGYGEGLATSGVPL
jgi:hypothetical protein